MPDMNELRALSVRLTALRADLLNRFPFFGRLLLHLQFGYAPCGTAYTDMRKIVFDPSFAARLPDEEVQFVLLHEVMHCVLHHCTRGGTLHHNLYNIACDIVVNSLILEVLHDDSFSVNGMPVMHLAPDGLEGREYSAEQVYEMLLRDDAEEIMTDCDSFRDEHEPWEEIDSSVADDMWEQHIRAASKAVGNKSGIPLGLKRYLKEIEHTPTTNWRQILHDFIQHDRSDFVYERPDHRFQGDVIMPSFVENVYGDRVEKLWFLIDTSGSVSDESLSAAFLQISQALEQIDSLTGELAFFDCALSPFTPFHSVEDLYGAEPVGGGGTSFHVIFHKLEERVSAGDAPAAIIIITDGFASFPDEEAAMGIPVLWIITEDGAEPPWGTCIRL